MKHKTSEILLRLTTEIDAFTSDDLHKIAEDEVVAAYHGDIFLAEGVDASAIIEGERYEYTYIGSLTACLIEYNKLGNLPKTQGESAEEVLADYGVDKQTAKLMAKTSGRNPFRQSDHPASTTEKLLYVQSIHLLADYRHKDLGKLSLEACIQRLGDKHTTVILPILPHQFDKEPDLAESWMFFTNDAQSAIKTLSKHFESLAFKSMKMPAVAEGEMPVHVLFRPAVIGD